MILEPQSKFRIGDIEELLAETKPFTLSTRAWTRLKKGRALVEKLARGSEAIYGVNTGLGKLAQLKISLKDISQLQINFLRSHATGIGNPLPPGIVRRLILLRIIGLGKGHSGISIPVLERHLDYFHRGLIPHIPEKGSVGASGDLAPLAHLGITLLGEGEFVEKGNFVSAEKVLRREKLKPLKLGAKESLSLFNGTQFSLALGLEARKELQHLLPWQEAALCLSVEAHRATSAVYEPKIHELKAHRHQLQLAKRFSKNLSSSKHMEAHQDCEIVQDSYSFRCVPQILGPAYSLLEKADELLEGEINSVSDNPLLFLESKEILSAGHFHAHSVSFACDLMSMAATTMANLIERRIDQMVNPATARHPAFLADKPGLESGLMILQTAAASLASENKALSFPASSDTIPTNGNQEDHVSMAPWAARKTSMIIDNLRSLLAMEILTGVRGAVLESTRTGKTFSPFVEKFLARLSRQIPSLFKSGDRLFARDLRDLEAFLKLPF